MRAFIRSAVVGVAALGLAGFGAAAAQANGGGEHHEPCCESSYNEWSEQNWESDHSIEDSIVFGPMMNETYDIEVGDVDVTDIEDVEVEDVELEK